MVSMQWYVCNGIHAMVRVQWYVCNGTCAKLKACDMHQDMEDKTDEERKDNRFAWKMRKRAMIQATEVCLCSA